MSDQAIVQDPLRTGLAVFDEPARDGEFQRLEAVDTLAPGYYWRVTKPLKVAHEKWEGHFANLQAGDVHLLLDIFEFEGAAHTAILLCHPRQGDADKYKVLIADFFSHFEPAPDGEAVRAAEQAAIMGKVEEIQRQMAAAEANPLALPGVQEAAQEAVEQFERDLVAEASQEMRTAAERKSDLRKLHRRAARRSQAAGNPLVVRSTTISDNLDAMLAGGIDSEGLRDLTVEARRRTAIATASSTWLTEQAKSLGATLKRLAPFYAEKGQVALARASKAIKYVQTLTQGLTSLKLYTGDGVDVVTICEGSSAQSSEPLTLVQAKKFMDEELAVWADVSESFDWRKASVFFDKLQAEPSLVNQVFPTSRCVVSMATTQRDIEYKNTNVFEAAMNAIKNRSVFLLVRDGGNIHAVYSTEPSHEGASRLFPSGEEVNQVFRGIDGSRIGLQDVAFSKATEKFEATSLLYLRFLILCMGLDHRMKLFGEFYPAGQATSFMKLDFQQRYFRFLADDEHATLVGEAIPPVSKWMSDCNRSVRSGSRVVVVDTNLRAASPYLKRTDSFTVDQDAAPEVFIVQREGKHHYISVPIKHRWRETDVATAKVWLDGPDAIPGAEWFLCLDTVQLPTLRRYIYSRLSRAGHISWLRAFKKAERVVAADLTAQEALRAHLRATALEHQVLTSETVDAAIETAVTTWRAARRGAAAPELGDIKGVQELLTLMYPAGKLAGDAEDLIQALITELGAKPLRMARTGKTRLVLYVEANEEDKSPYAADGAPWGWVKRIQIEVKRTKLAIGTSSLVWLMADAATPQEEVIRTWPGIDAFLHKYPAPCSLKHLEHARTSIAEAAAYSDVLAEGRAKARGRALNAWVFDEILSQAETAMNSIPRRGGYRYYQPAFVVLPVGVATRITEGKPPQTMFIHLRMPVAGFLMRYGSMSQVDAFREIVSTYRKMQQEIFRSGQNWAMFSSPEPVMERVCLGKGDWVVPQFSLIRSHERGGVKRADLSFHFHGVARTRAERRALNGRPMHTEMTAHLSFDRAVQAMLGRAPHQRRLFYRDAFRILNSKRENPKWSPPVVHTHLSGLIWDADRRRPVANKHFSLTHEKEVPHAYQ